MITNLHIKNIGIIDDLEIDLNKGMNVLTGETGAGKTLIIDSLGIICGGRFSKEMIRNGEKNSFVEMSVYLPNSEYEDDTLLIYIDTDYIIFMKVFCFFTTSFSFFAVDTISPIQRIRPSK